MSNATTSFGCHQANQKQAFTLTELLVVMAVVTVMSALAVPAVISLSNAGNVNQAVSEISLSLGQARTYAMAHNTYVWMGFASNTTSQQLTVGIVAGTTGNVGDLNSAATYTPVSKLQTYNNLSLKAISGLTGMSTSENDITTSQVGTFAQSGGGVTVTFTNVLQFSPQGEASVDVTSGSSHWIQIGLQPVRGGNASNPDVAVFQVAALTGQVQIFRP